MFKSKFSYWFTEVEIKDVSRLHSRSYEVTGEVCVVELEMSLVVELEKGGRVGMLLLQMDVVNLRLFSGEAAVLADVHLRPPLLVLVLMSNSVNLQAVAF